MPRLARPPVRVLAWLPALMWMMVIFVLSAQPDSEPVRTAGGSFRLDPAKLGHVVVYSILAVSVGQALLILGVRRIRWWAFVIVVLYAISDEIHQAFVPGRGPSVLDLVIDSASGLGAVSAWLWVMRRMRLSGWPSSVGSGLWRRESRGR